MDAKKIMQLKEVGIQTYTLRHPDGINFTLKKHDPQTGVWMICEVGTVFDHWVPNVGKVPVQIIDIEPTAVTVMVVDKKTIVN